MSIQKINAVAPQFASSVANGVQNVSAPADFEQKPINVKNATLNGLGALGVAGLALLAIRRGKLSKMATSLDDFRAKGNQLVKGKAVKPNGKPYTGIISSVDRRGKLETHFEYENGILKSAKKYEVEQINGPVRPPEGYVPRKKLIDRKVYNYDENGKLVSVIRQEFQVTNPLMMDDPRWKPNWEWVDVETFDIKKMQNVGKQRGLLRAIGNEPILDSNLANGYQVFKHNADKIPGKEKIKSYKDFLEALDLEETDVKNGKLTNKAKERLKKLWEKQGIPETFTWNELIESAIKERQQGPEIKAVNEVVNKKFLPPSNEATKSIIPGVLDEC